MFRPSLGLFESSWRFWEPKCWNAQFWPLTWPWPDTWPFKKNFKSALEPSRRDLSNAASPVSLRSLVWELAWGDVVPGQWRSAETPVKRGLSYVFSPFLFRFPSVQQLSPIMLGPKLLWYLFSITAMHGGRKRPHGWPMAISEFLRFVGVNVLQISKLKRHDQYNSFRYRKNDPNP